MVKVALLAAFATACFDDNYRCKRDAECNVGEGGRCEADNYCTKFDEECPTQRRYQHAGEHGNECFDDRVLLANPCAGGQSPAKREGCFVDVCERLPACCDVAWTDACVQIAQEECESLVCSTTIAITATRGAQPPEIWDLQWAGAWAVFPAVDFSPPLHWVAPAPGKIDPRLSGMNAAKTELVIGEFRYPISAGRSYSSVTTINFDRDGRDTIVAAHSMANSDHTIDVIKPHDLSTRTAATSALQASAGLTWGDIDRDLFVDAVTRAGGSYQYVPSFVDKANGHLRALSSITTVGVGGNGVTGNAPTLRTVDWIDLNGDTQLDLVGFGAEIRVHTDPNVLRQLPEHQIDCNPPAAFLQPDPDRPAPCATQAEPNFEAVSFGGAGVPAKGAPQILVTTFPGRRMLRGNVEGNVFTSTAVPFPDETCTCTQDCNPLPCTYTCPATCSPVIGVVVRDLDGDHVLDAIAIDGFLRVYHALGPSFDFNRIPPYAIPTNPPNGIAWSGATLSVSGAPIQPFKP